MSAHYYDVHEKKRIQNEKQIENENNLIKMQKEIGEIEKKEKEELRIKEEQIRNEKLEIERIKEIRMKELLRQKQIEENERQEKIKQKNSYYECYIDNKVFESEKEYIEHFNNYHKNDFPFYCDICNKGFFSYKSINDHYIMKGH